MNKMEAWELTGLPLEEWHLSICLLPLLQRQFDQRGKKEQSIGQSMTEMLAQKLVYETTFAWQNSNEKT